MLHLALKKVTDWIVNYTKHWQHNCVCVQQNEYKYYIMIQ